MNDKYFNENKFEDFSAYDLHRRILDIAGCITANLMVEVEDPTMRKKDREANAYHLMIALCEAGLSKLDANDVEESRERTSVMVKPAGDEEFGYALLAALLGLK